MRHLEEIHGQTELLVLETVQKLLVDGNTDKSVDLLGKWEAYSRVKGTGMISF